MSQDSQEPGEKPTDEIRTINWLPARQDHRPYVTAALVLIALSVIVIGVLAYYSRTYVVIIQAR